MLTQRSEVLTGWAKIFFMYSHWGKIARIWCHSEGVMCSDDQETLLFCVYTSWLGYLAVDLGWCKFLSFACFVYLLTNMSRNNGTSLVSWWTVMIGYLEDSATYSLRFTYYPWSWESCISMYWYLKFQNMVGSKALLSLKKKLMTEVIHID